MPTQCSICAHPEREQIDEALAAHTTLAEVSQAYSLSRTSVWRHYSRHLQGKPRRRAYRVSPAAAFLLDRLQNLYENTARILHDHGQADPDLALRAIQRLESLLLLQHRLAPQGSQFYRGIEPARLRHLLDSALSPFPEARAAIIRALEEASPRPAREHSTGVPSGQWNNSLENE